jgi:hypothetical protein
MEFMPRASPYGRRRGLIAMMLAAPPVVMLTLAVTERLSGTPSPPTWSNTIIAILGLEYFFGAMAAFGFAHPRPRATDAREGRVLRIPLWRRAAFASLLPVPVCIGLAADIARGNVSPWIVAGVVLVMVASLIVTSERIAISLKGIERIGGIGWHHRIAWNEIWRLEISEGGLRVRGEEGKSISVPGLWLDGYPEFVAMLLERAPEGLLRQMPDDVRESLLVIADLADPSGATRRRGGMAKP